MSKEGSAGAPLPGLGRQRISPLGGSALHAVKSVGAHYKYNCHNCDNCLNPPEDGRHARRTQVAQHHHPIEQSGVTVRLGLRCEASCAAKPPTRSPDTAHTALSTFCIGR